MDNAVEMIKNIRFISIKLVLMTFLTQVVMFSKQLRDKFNLDSAVYIDFDHYIIHLNHNAR